MIELEFLAIVYALQKFLRLVLFNKCQVHTDHKPILGLLEKKLDNLPIYTKVDYSDSGFFMTLAFITLLAKQMCFLMHSCKILLVNSWKKTTSGTQSIQFVSFKKVRLLT